MSDTEPEETEQCWYCKGDGEIIDRHQWDPQGPTYKECPECHD